jgi:hypothetical protein
VLGRFMLSCVLTRKIGESGMAALRIFSYLPNLRIWKATITARLCDVEIEVRGAAPRELSKWLWDFDARPTAEVGLETLASVERIGRIGFADQTLYKTDAFLEAHPFGTVPAAFSPDGRTGIFESNSIMRAVARLAGDRFPVYGRNAYESSRIDSFLDANLVFARDGQIYLLALGNGAVSSELHGRMKGASRLTCPASSRRCHHRVLIWLATTSRWPTSALPPSFVFFTTRRVGDRSSTRPDSRLCLMTNSRKVFHDRQPTLRGFCNILHSFRTLPATWTRSQTRGRGVKGYAPRRRRSNCRSHPDQREALDRRTSRSSRTTATTTRSRNGPGMAPGSSARQDALFRESELRFLFAESYQRTTISEYRQVGIGTGGTEPGNSASEARNYYVQFG